MRPLNTLEKKFIEKLITFDRNEQNHADKFSCFLQEKVFTSGQGLAPIFIYDKDIILLYVSSNEQKSLPSLDAAQKLRKFAKLISFIQELEEQRYICVIPFSSSERTGIDFVYQDFGNGAYFDGHKERLFLNDKGDYFLTSDSSIIYNSNDTIIFKGFSIDNKSPLNTGFKKYINALILVNQTLIEYAKADFIDDNERRFREEQVLFREKQEFDLSQSKEQQIQANEDRDIAEKRFQEEQKISQHSLKIAQRGIGIAVTTAVVSVAVSAVTFWLQQRDTPIKLERTQFDVIKKIETNLQSIRSLEQERDALRNEINMLRSETSSNELDSSEKTSTPSEN